MFHAQYRGLSITYTDQLEYDTLIEEVFKKNTYYVDLDKREPLIVDVGAHIGMTTLYFHTLYPHARHLCIEANPENVVLLAKNLSDNFIDTATIIPKAVVGASENRENIAFYTNHKLTVFSSLAQGGWTGDQEGDAVLVPTVKLSALLTEPIDILKVDIEGAETQVLFEAKEKLTLVSHLLCEFHKTKTHDETKLLRLLHEKFAVVDVREDERTERRHDNKLLMIEAKSK